MTPDEITRMAREAGMERIIAIEIDGTQTFEVARIDLLERFAALVAAHVRETEFKPGLANYRQGLIDGAADEREACARFIDEQDAYGDPVYCWFEHLAAEIRARGDV
jgi:hypothetical protein